MHTPSLARTLLSCLRAHGQRLDVDIARETGVSVQEVRDCFAALLTSGDVIACKLTRFQAGKPVISMMYRASGYFPPVGAGRKSKPVEVAGAAADLARRVPPSEG